MPIRVSPRITLQDDEIEEVFVRASGPGGQNVNKVASAVQLRFDVEGSPSLSPAVKARLKKLAGSRLTNDGVLVIQADRQRSQARNRGEAIERLVDLIRDAEHPPKHRIPTRPTLASKRRRLEGKTKRSTVKTNRQKPEI